MNILSKSVPLPNTADNRLEALRPSLNNEDQVTAKIDHQIKPSHRVSGTFFLLQGSGFDPFPSTTQVPDYAGQQHRPAPAERGDQLRLDRQPDHIEPGALRLQPPVLALESAIRTSWADYGSKVTLGVEPPRPPQLFINGRWQMGTFGESQYTQGAYNWSDTVSMTRGAHSIRAGAQVIWNRYLEKGNWLGSAQVRFNGSFTNSTLADFMLGQASSFRQNNGQNRHVPFQRLLRLRAGRLADVAGASRSTWGCATN